MSFYIDQITILKPSASEVDFTVFEPGIDGTDGSSYGNAFCLSFKKACRLSQSQFGGFYFSTDNGNPLVNTGLGILTSYCHGFGENIIF